VIISACLSEVMVNTAKD